MKKSGKKAIVMMLIAALALSIMAGAGIASAQ